MTDSHSSHGHDDHASPSPSGLKMVLTILTLAVLPLLIVIGLIDQYRAHDSGMLASSMTEEVIAGRIQKVGLLTIGSASHEPKTGEAVFKAQCTTCHTAGLVGAPKFGDAAAWAPRIQSGYATLLNSALKGKGNMTPQGGGAFSDYEVARALVYMANAGGAKFEEPAAPADAAAAPAAAASATN